MMKCNTTAEENFFLLLPREKGREREGGREGGRERERNLTTEGNTVAEEKKVFSSTLREREGSGRGGREKEKERHRYI